ncbi:pilus (MSHA type) biogenesis protein MshL [Marinibactrum halimedae]|uniref:pilus (MSHA type) biogenesis protein MshL n=1 Tax=Marinibactrum halimedae TaxID=1444977 RepID=UPI001E65A558|nr:pilus (MSHA type) biogenesis protein MshL [Marinibactrum halimedae]MCD9460824.1 pilus (MSHA type) biogenesis protein MshL [Marinibactrum halimedae]
MKTLFVKQVGVAASLSAVVLLGLLGCSSNTQPPSLADQVEQERIRNTDHAAMPSGAPSTPPQAVTDALLNSSSGLNNRTGQEAALPLESRFDISVNEVPARAFFLGLVEGTRHNMVVHPSVSGAISLELKNVTIEETLKVVRDIFGYEYKLDSGIYRVYPRELRSEIFHIDYLDVQRAGTSDTSVLVGELTSNNNNGQNGNNRNNNNNNMGGGLANLVQPQGVGGVAGAGGLGGLGGLGAGAQNISLPGSRVQTLNQTDFWGNLQEAVIAIIGGEEGDRSVVVAPQAGMVVVKAMPSELSAVREFLERSELNVSRQVILEAKILEVGLNDEFSAGINWGAISGQALYGYDVSEFANGNQIVTVDDGVGGLFGTLLSVGDVSTLINLLESQGNVQVLSSPRVSTVNNQKAVIRVGSDEYFVTGISTTTTASTATTSETPNVELASFFSGISLDVTPQIAENGDVILHIHPIVSEVTDQQKSFTLGDDQFTLPLAFRDIRESDTIVRARSGQVIVLGGLMQESTTKTDRRRPVLGDIPLLNGLFRANQKGNRKTELVILLKPLVIDDETWDSDLRNTETRMRSIEEALKTRREW